MVENPPLESRPNSLDKSGKRPAAVPAKKELKMNRAFHFVEALETRRLMTAGNASGDMVLRWNDVAMDVLRADRTLPGPGWASRSLAITSLAVYDAVNSVDGNNEAYAGR